MGRISMHLAASGVLAAMELRAVDLVHTLKILPVLSYKYRYRNCCVPVLL
jgi:hypothetical protein